MGIRMRRNDVQGWGALQVTKINYETYSRLGDG